MSDAIFGPNGWNLKDVGSLKGKTYVITGANLGIGFEATKIFLKHGAKVLMLNRNEEKTRVAIDQIKKELGNNVALDFIKMDLASLNSVRNGAEQVLNNYPQIDALICNAGVGNVAKRGETEDGFELTIGINHFGHFLLSNLLFNRVEESRGRILFASSTSYKMGDKKVYLDNLNFTHGYKPFPVYGHSKLCLTMFAYELQRRVEEANKQVEIQVYHPGAAQTSFGDDESAGLLKFALTLLVYTLGQSAYLGSLPIVLCTTQDGLKKKMMYGPTKRNEMMGPIKECPLEPHVLDLKTAGALWEISEEATDCKWDFL